MNQSFYSFFRKKTITVHLPAFTDAADSGNLSGPGSIESDFYDYRRSRLWKNSHDDEYCT